MNYMISVQISLWGQNLNNLTPVLWHSLFFLTNQSSAGPNPHHLYDVQNQWSGFFFFLANNECLWDSDKKLWVPSHWKWFSAQKVHIIWDWGLIDPMKLMFGTQVRTYILDCASALTQPIIWWPLGSETHLLTWLEALCGCRHWRSGGKNPRWCWNTGDLSWS